MMIMLHIISHNVRRTQKWPLTVDKNPKAAPHHAARSQGKARPVSINPARVQACPSPTPPSLMTLPDIVEVSFMGNHGAKGPPPGGSIQLECPPSPVIANPRLAGISRRARRPGTRLCRGQREFSAQTPAAPMRPTGAIFCQLGMAAVRASRFFHRTRRRRPLRHRRPWHRRLETRSRLGVDVERRLSSLSLELCPNAVSRSK